MISWSLIILEINPTDFRMVSRFEDFMMKCMLVILILLGTSNSYALRVSAQMPEQIKLSIQEDLAWLTQISSSSLSALFKERFNCSEASHIGKCVSDFIYKNIHYIGYKNIETFYVLLANGSGAVFLTPHYVKLQDKYSRLDRIAGLLHEADHNLRRNHHIRCPRLYSDGGTLLTSHLTGQILTGKNLCDANFRGAYGAELLFFQQLILKCKNCENKYIDDAKRLHGLILHRLIDLNSKQLLSY